MRAIILAAGYATRLYPLTEHFPKPLLEVGGRTILDRLVDQIRATLPDAPVTLVSNHRFIAHFRDWAARRGDAALETLDDGSTGPEDRLGAIGDLRFALDRIGENDDLLVAAADNIFDFSLGDFVAAFRRRPGVWICVHRVEDPARRRRTGIAELGSEDRVVGFQEKPAAPRSEWGVPPLYLFDRAAAPQISKFLAGGGSPDAPGGFIEWLCPRVEIRAFRAPGAIHDIGTLESLVACRAQFAAQCEESDRRS